MKARLQRLGVAGWLVLLLIGGAVFMGLLEAFLEQAKELLGDRLLLILVNGPLMLLLLFGVWWFVVRIKPGDK